MEQPEVILTLESHLRTTLPRNLDLLRQMVEINSFTSNPQGVNTLGTLTIAAFSELGFCAQRVQAADFSYGQHIVMVRQAHMSNGRRPPKIGLIAHLDTVYPTAEERENDFHWRVAGKKIYGPGVYDIKGGTVMIYMILDALRAAAPALFDSVTWVLLLNAAEEALVADFGQLCLDHLAGDALAALVFEGGEVHGSELNDFALVVARKGMARFHVRVEGKGAHAGTEHNHGANAISQLADVICKIADLTDYDEQVTLNVGTIAGGTVLNRVPHEASASIELRAYSSQRFAATAQRIVAFNEFSSVFSANGGYPCRVRVDVLGQWEPWAQNRQSESLLGVWRAAGQMLGLRVLPQERGGLSDGNWTWRQVPTIDGLGPDGGNAHSSQRLADGSKEQEYILPASYVPKALLNALAVMRLVEEAY